MGESLKKIFVALFHISEEDVNTAAIGVTEKWTSLSHIQLVMKIEQELNCARFSPDEISKMTNFENVSRIVEKRLI
jgi:acyl carrier protein